MPPLNSWMVITVRIPPILAILVGIVLVGLIAVAATIFRRNTRKIHALTRQVDELNAEIAESDISSIRDAYLQFTYNISHEVSNPLQSVQTNLENMADCSPGEMGRWKQYYAIIKQEIKRLFTLTDNLRLLSQLERVTGPVEREPLNLKSVIENVIMAQLERASGKNISIKYDGPSRPAKVFGNQTHLHQLIMNLVDNSIKYSKDAGGEIVIQLSEEDETMHVVVRDNGVGIPIEDLPFVFDMAYRSPSTLSTHRSGSGLGLAIVKRIIEQHEGKVRADSIVGEGTTVTVDLPIYNPS